VYISPRAGRYARKAPLPIVAITDRSTVPSVGCGDKQAAVITEIRTTRSLVAIFTPRARMIFTSASIQTAKDPS
jgi:hypothetical protein